MARSLAAELGPRGVRVNSLSPGIVRTHFAAKTNVAEDEFEGFIQMVASQAPLGREGTTADMANAALYLADPASSYVTASDLVIGLPPNGKHRTGFRDGTAFAPIAC